MDLKHLSDEALLKNAGALIRQENEAFTASLHHFLEIERRRLYAKLKYSSLFAFFMGEYGHTENEANRRISAMYLIKELPEVEEKIVSGALSLTNAVLARSHFRKEAKCAEKPLTKAEKIELIENLEHKTTREAERIVLSQSSVPVEIKPDKIKPVTESLTEFKFVGEKEIEDLLLKLKGLQAHKSPRATTGDLVKLALEIAIQQLDPAQKKVRARKTPLSAKLEQTTKSKEKRLNQESPMSVQDQSPPTEQPSPSAPKVDRALEYNAAASDQMQSIRFSGRAPMLKKNSNQTQETCLPSQAAIRREVWRRAQSRCEKCGSNYALEIDHIIPRAKGGGDHKENLRLLCRSCNQRAAIDHFGVRKMDRFRVAMH